MNELVKENVIELLIQVDRQGMSELFKHMEQIEYFDAPCSTQFHLCRPGGLAEHSLNVYRKMKELDRVWNVSDFNITDENIIICSLLHDIGKAGYRGQQNYLPNILKSKELSKSKPYETNKNRPHISHEIISLQIISKFIELTEEEEFAILYHNGLYVSSGRDINGKERKLQLMLHFSDMWASRFVDDVEAK